MACEKSSNKKETLLKRWSDLDLRAFFGSDEDLKKDVVYEAALSADYRQVFDSLKILPR